MEYTNSTDHIFFLLNKLIIGNTKGFIRGKALATEDALANKASASHTHSASDIVSGILPISRGGTGRNDNKASGLITAITLTLTGAVSGFAKIDGSSNVSIDTILSDEYDTGPIATITRAFTWYYFTYFTTPLPVSVTHIAELTNAERLVFPLFDNAAVGIGAPIKLGVNTEFNDSYYYVQYLGNGDVKFGIQYNGSGYVSSTESTTIVGYRK